MKLGRVALLGANGKMGREIIAVMESVRTKIEIKYFISKSKSSVKNWVTLGDIKPNAIDAIIDFSSPEAMSEALGWCVKNRVAFVSGTTGISAKHEKQMDQAAKVIPVFWASNFSVGIALINEMIKVFSNHPDFDFQIEELHHRNKKDSPSGTAKTLQNHLEKIVKKDLPQPISVRGGEIFGIHKIWAMSSTEIITIEHTALNRRAFAEGAIQATAWLIGQKSGKFTMQDLLRTP